MASQFRMSHVLLAMIFATCAVMLYGETVSAQEYWPQWRGPNLDSVSDSKDLPAEFNNDTNLHWRFELPGPGGASPVVWGDHIFVISVDSDEKILLQCVDKSGEEKWQRHLKGENQKSRDNANSASPSPCTDGEHVWANSTAGFLECFDMNGNPVWDVDLQDRYGKFEIQFGMTSTPILDEGRLYLQLIHGSMREKSTSEGWIVAIDAKTGDEIWKHKRLTDGIRENKHSYASPTIFRDGDTAYMIVHGGDYITGHSLENGDELWRCGGLNPKGQGYNPYLRFVASPLCFDGKIIVPSAKQGPVFCLKTDLKDDVSEKDEAFYWKTQKVTPDVSTPACDGSLVFLTRENGVLTVLDFETGEETFSKRMFIGNHRSSPVIADGKVFIADRQGKIVVVTAEEEPKLLAKNDLKEETTASIAISDGRIYVRTFKALYSFGNVD